MKTFLIKMFIFTIPIGLLFVFPLSVMVLAREFMDAEKVIETQNASSENILVNFAYGNYTKRLKVLGVLKRDPDIIVLGSSRTLQFRSLFFKNDTVFFNAGSVLGYTSDLPDFMHDIEDAENVKIVLVSIDARLLQHYDTAWLDDKQESISQQLHDFLAFNWRKVYEDYFSRKFTVSELYARSRNSEHIGLAALMRGRGIRSDGSFEYGSAILNNPQRVPELHAAVSKQLTGLESGGGLIEYDESISEKHLSEIEDFLRVAKNRNIHVIGYLPPYPTEIVTRTAALQDRRGDTFREVPRVLEALFKKYDYNFYDASLLSTIGSSENEMVDTEHVSEKGTLRLLRYLSFQEPTLAEHVDFAAIEKLLSSESDVEVY